MRIVGGFDRGGQDVLVAGLADLFSGERRTPRVVDRRAEPVQGYRAVHVIVFPQGIPIEIQVRTRWQHEWAELVEKLADRVGRGIRYGEPPKRLFSQAEFDELPPEVREAASVFNSTAS
jgi:ppGpp synthetase/RelA/SpoT-type nucleotidyltranferase